MMITAGFMLLIGFFLFVTWCAVLDLGRRLSALSCLVALIYGAATTATCLSLIEYLSQ